MAGASAQFHESTSQLQPGTMERHRATVSLMEELEAVDWYDQRIDASADPELVAILRHNRDEEKEHASMLLEWLRRQDAAWDAQLRHYLFTDAPIADIAGAGEAGGSDEIVRASGRGRLAVVSSGESSLGIGALRNKEGL
jgi:ferritin-like protein